MTGCDIPYETGFRVALREIQQGVASFTRAQQRGIYEWDQLLREEWDTGYDDCVCAWRLGHDVEDMVRTGNFGPSLMVMSYVVDALLDGYWDRTLREDPRKISEAGA